MFKIATPCTLLLLALTADVASAEPIELRLAFFSSDQSTTYLAAIKPFIDAVNSDGHDQVKIVLYSGVCSEEKSHNSPMWCSTAKPTLLL